MPNLNFSDGTQLFYRPAQLVKELEQKAVLCKTIKKMQSLLMKDDISISQETIQKLSDILYSSEIEFITRGT